jgi:glutamyl-tRNA synthetase
METKVRFAPSPTGYLHVGGLRTALYNYLYVKKVGGNLLLRIEDTDQSRKVENATVNLLSTFKKLNIQFDEGPECGGENGPYFQSQRLDIYR